MSTKHNTQEEGAFAPLTFRLSPEEREAMKRIARREHRSMAGQLRAWIDENDRDEPDPDLPLAA